MKLSHISISGLMTGRAWGGFDAESYFDARFHARPDELRSTGVRQDTWIGLDEALQSALAWGDVWGGQGDLIEGSLTFHMYEINKRGDVVRKSISRDLETLRAAKPYLAAQGHYGFVTDETGKRVLAAAQ